MRAGACTSRWKAFHNHSCLRLADSCYGWKKQKSSIRASWLRTSLQLVVKRPTEYRLHPRLGSCCAGITRVVHHNPIRFFPPLGRGSSRLGWCSVCHLFRSCRESFWVSHESPAAARSFFFAVFIIVFIILDWFSRLSDLFYPSFIQSVNRHCRHLLTITRCSCPFHFASSNRQCAQIFHSSFYFFIFAP